MPSKELVVSQTRHETKVAILEDGQLVEVFFQRENEYSLAGSIHKGRVTRVLPGMQSAFVDLGLERDTFLYVSDFFEENGEEIEKVSSAPPSRQREERGRDDRGGRGDRDRDRGGDRDRDRGGDRERGSADRDRGSDREPTREREPRQAMLAVPPTPMAEDVLDSVELTPEVAEAGGTSVQSTAATEAERERRGRRSRRRRNRGRGFPDSKYAPASGQEETPEERDEPEQRADVVEEPSGIELLPGESLARFRSTPPRPAMRPPQMADTEQDEADAEIEEPVEAPARVELPESLASGPESVEEISDLEAEAVEQILERVEEQVERAVLASPEPESTTLEASVTEIASSLDNVAEDVEEETAVAESPAESEDDDEEELEIGEEPGYAEGLLAEAGLDEATVDEEESESTEAQPVGEASGDAPAGEGSDVEPARMPQSLTATLRAQGGRYPHRGSRRVRRRGGRDRDRQERPVDSAAGPVVEIAQPAAEPREREAAREGVREGGREGGRERERERPAMERSSSPVPSISDLLKEGQEIIVQIAKEPLGQKGARITSHIAMPGRYVVYMPTVEHLGVSRKIGSDEERQRLKRILQTHRQGIAGGFIMRTAGEGKSEPDIQADMTSLANLWLDIRAKAEKRRAPALLHHDVEVVERLLRDQLTEGFKAVWVDNEELYEQVLHSVERIQPALLSRVKMYTRPEPIFDAFGITLELEKALRPKVWLKSGGYIVINQTEALVAIDVNTGKYVGKSNRLEDTIVKTNLEAVKEIVRQMRLRDLGGIIVVDFIDMEDRKNRQKVMQSLEETMRCDKAPYKILQFNDFGLVAITRKRVKQSLERALCSPCPHCEGAGYVKSVQTVIAEILSQAIKYAKVVDGKECILRVHPEVAKTLKSTENKYLEELEEVLRRPVLVVSDPLLHQEKYDLT